MSVGIIILAHRDLNRVGQLARALTKRDCRLVIHVDAHTDDTEFNDLVTFLSSNKKVTFATRVACEWGGFSLVQASLNAASTLMDKWPDLSHVCQISGSCLPTRPINELSAFLTANPGVDFVESIPAQSQGRGWVVDGLEMERFTLHFPFSYRRQRFLFDKSVDLQRRFGLRRRIPEGLEPHLGSQWWCLSRETLDAILRSENRARYDTFFKRCWIPDEAYFPTLVRRYGQNVVSRSLTLSRFDEQGKPYIFYNDHEDLLLESEAFFARKIWSGADKLYRRFLSQRQLNTVRENRDPARLETTFKAVRAKRCSGKPGRINQGRFPVQTFDGAAPTAASYRILQGFTHLFADFPAWLNQTDNPSLGRVFKAGRVGFFDAHAVLPGGLPTSVKFRDYNPEQFLVNLIWNMRAAPPILLHDIADAPKISQFLARDPNAYLTLITGSWALDLFHRGKSDDGVLRRSAMRLLTQERAQLEALRTTKTPAFVATLATAFGDPTDILGKALNLPEGTTPPNFREIQGFTAFLERLENLGINLETLGDVRPELAKAATRPQLRIVAQKA